jgi:hypothetical protein
MFTKLQNSSTRRQKKLPPQAARALLCIEPLEKREVLSATVYWTGNVNMNWNQPGNWSTVDPLINNVPSQILPGPTDNVVIDLRGKTVNHSSDIQDVIASLQVTDVYVNLNLSAGTLDLSGNGDSGSFQVDQANDTVNLQGGTLKNATVTSGTTITAGSLNVGGTLDGVTLNGTLDLNDSSATIKNGLILNGVIKNPGSGNSTDPGGLKFDDYNGPQTLSTTGSGEIDFGAEIGMFTVLGDTLTIGAGVTIRAGVTTESVFPAQGHINGPIDNFGAIKDDAGGFLTINYGQAPGSTYTWEQIPGSLVHWTNHGTIEVSNGLLQLGGPFINNGSITAGSGTKLFLGDGWVQGALDPHPTGDAWVNNGTITTGGGEVYLGGNLTYAPTSFDPAALGLGADTVYLTGSLDNTGHTLTLAAGVTSISGDWTVWTGQINGGTVDETAGTLKLTQGGSLNGVTEMLPPEFTGGSGFLTVPPISISILEPVSNQTFIANVYADLLNRLVDSGGLAAWSSLMDQGVAGTQIVAGIQSSLEYKIHEVNRTYKIFLHREADPSGLQTGLQIVAMFGLRAEYAFLTGSPEYRQTRSGSTIEAWLNTVYVDAFNRSIDSSAETAFSQALSSGAVSFQQAADILFTSPEFNQDIIGTYYTGFLGRYADSAGLAFWANKLLSGQSLENIIAGIVGSSEYFNQMRVKEAAPTPTV